MPKNLTRIRGALVVCLAAQDGTPREPPTEFRIFPAGSFDTIYGPFVFDEESAKTVLAHRDARGVDLRVDYEHASEHVDSAADPAEAGKAAGWFTVELRNGELWATNVRWTPPAAEKLKNGEFRYLSPTFAQVDGRITRLMSIALTNNPATLDAQPLVSLADRRTGTVALSVSFDAIADALRSQLREGYGEAWIVELFDDAVVFESRGTTWRASYAINGTTITLDGAAVEVTRQYLPAEGARTMKTLLKALGVAETATESEAIVALNAREARTTELVALTGKASVAEAIGVVQAWKRDAEQVTSLSARVKELEGKVVETELSALIDEATKAGKATPAERASLEAIGRADITMLRANLEARQAITSVTKVVTPAGGAETAVELTAEEKTYAERHGIDLVAMLEAKKARAAQA